MNLDDVFKELVWGPLVKAALALLFKAVPFLGWGPVGLAVGLIVNLLADKLYDVLKMTIDLHAIALKNAAMHRAYVAASLDLRRIAQDPTKGVDSEDFRRAREEHKKRLSEFVQWAA